MGSEPPEQGGGPRRRAHHRWALTLVVLGGVLTFAAILSIWINRQALDTGNWVRTSDRLLENEAVRDRLSEYLAEQLFARVDLGAELTAALPPRLAPLAGVAAGGLEQVAPQVASRILASGPFQAIWEKANRAAHESLLRVLDGQAGAISTAGGKVVLELRPAVERLAGRFGLESAAGRIPAGAGNITILESGELKTAQRIAEAVRRLPIVLTALLTLCFTAALYVAGPRRRQAVLSVGFAFIAAGLLALALRSLLGAQVVDTLTRVSSAEPAVESVWDIATSLLVEVATSAIAFGAILALAAWTAGETRPARALRRFAAPYAERGRASIYGTALVAFLILVAWAPIVAFRGPLGVLVFAVLFAIGTEAWRRQVLAESMPDPPVRASPGSGDAVPPTRP